MFDYMYDETNFYGIVDEWTEVYNDDEFEKIKNN